MRKMPAPPANPLTVLRSIRAEKLREIEDINWFIKGIEKAINVLSTDHPEPAGKKS